MKLICSAGCPLLRPFTPANQTNQTPNNQTWKDFFFLFGKWYVYRKELFPRISNINNLALET